MKKTKKGSSLVSVVIVFALLVIAASTLMMATLSGYKLRLRNDNRVENLYSAESGIDKIYADIANLIDNAIAKGNEAVIAYNKNELRSEIEEEEAKLQEYINEKLKLEDENKEIGYKWEGAFINENGTLKENVIYIKRNELFKKIYKETIEGSIDDTVLNSNDKKIYNVEIFNDSLVFNEKEELNAEVKSSFLQKDIERCVKTTFNLKTPEYNSNKEYKMTNIEIKNIFTKSFVAGKDLVNKGNVDINGDVYVYANGEETTGVIIEKNANLTLRGSLVSLKDTRLKGENAKLNIKNNDKDLGKIFTGSLAIDRDADGSNINVAGKLYANNDLILNAKKSNILVENGFYGINDIGTKESDKTKEYYKNSSCIIINSDDIGMVNGSSLTIKKEAVFMGTAYISVDPVYQTGESVSIKGNYRAYGLPLRDKGYENGKYTEDNIIFQYRSPLLLVTDFKDKTLGDMLYNDKENYLGQYGKEYNWDNINRGQGIKLPDKVISVGATFNDGTFSKGNINIDKENNEVQPRKKEYIQAINQLKKGICKEVGKDEVEIDFDAMTNTCEINSYGSEKEVIYLNNSYKPCVILGDGEASTSKDEIEIGKQARGIIISKGDIYIKGNIDEFRGTIISAGSIIFEDGNKQKFIYDSNYLNKLIASRYKLFKNVLIGTNNSSKVVIWDNGESGEINKEEYLRKNLLKSINWKIVK